MEGLDYNISATTNIKKRLSIRCKELGKDDLVNLSTLERSLSLSLSLHINIYIYVYTCINTS